MFLYFGFGSNMDRISLSAKGVEPVSSWPAVLPGWRLRFNVEHFFRHEGGVGNIEPAPDTGEAVQGVLHRCKDADLAALDAAEACDYGYRRITVPVQSGGETVQALTYVGMPAFINEACRPSRRYLNILIRGAEAARLDGGYVAALRAQAVHTPPDYPPFRHPPGDHPVFDAGTLARAPLCTALYGAVFDMSVARPRHEFLKQLFGGRDMTLFHLQRMESSVGGETWDDIRYARLTAAQERHLNAYLQEYAREYRYVGRFRYGEPQGGR